MKIICCGNIAYDLISRGPDKHGNYSFHATPGGSVLNTAIQLARLGSEVAMLTKTGTDALSSTLIDIMKKEGIDTRKVLQDKGLRTGLAIAALDPEGDPSYSFYKTKGPSLSFGSRLPSSSFFENAAVFHTGSAYSYTSDTFQDVQKLLQLAKKNDVFVSYDPNWRAGRIKNEPTARKRIEKIIQYTDLLKLSDTDATGITGARTLNGALKRLPANTIITLGADGAFLWTGKKKIYHAPCRVKVEDTIGAGDAFTAGLIYSYTSKGISAFTDNAMESLAFASCVAAIVCSGRGAIEALKSAAQVRRSLKKRRS